MARTAGLVHSKPGLAPAAAATLSMYLCLPSRLHTAHCRHDYTVATIAGIGLYTTCLFTKQHQARALRLARSRCCRCTPRCRRSSSSASSIPRRRRCGRAARPGARSWCPLTSRRRRSPLTASSTLSTPALPSRRRAQRPAWLPMQTIGGLRASHWYLGVAKGVVEAAAVLQAQRLPPEGWRVMACGTDKWD